MPSMDNVVPPESLVMRSMDIEACSGPRIHTIHGHLSVFQITDHTIHGH